MGWSGWLSQTSPIPRSPDGDNNDNRVTYDQWDIRFSNDQITNMSSDDENVVTFERLQGWAPSSALYQLAPKKAFDQIDV